MKNKNYFKKLSLAFVMLVGFTNFVNAQVPSYVPSNGLVGYWPFSGNANDVSGNNYNGTVNGAALSTDRFGNVNSAYNFNGVSNYIRLGVANFTAIDALDNSDFSISLWVNSNSFVNGNLCFMNFGWGINISIDKNGFPVFGHVGIWPDNKWYSVSATTPNNLLNWYHIVSIKQGNTQKLFINGLLVNSSISSPAGLGNQVYVGGNPIDNNLYLNGKLDDIGFWNRALTADEITNLYNANLCYQSSFIINTGILSYNPPTYNNTITIYPNPANDHITIDCGNIANVTGYHIEIANSLGQIVFNKPMDTQQYTVALNTWSGQGIYFVKVYDASNNLLTTRKLILQ